MCKSDWEVLGIERTADLPSIKKAYATRLRVTRPDDDADAYQLLRAAYGRVQQWARSARHEDPSPEALIDPARAVTSAGEEEQFTELPAPPPEHGASEPIVGSAEVAAWAQRLASQRAADRTILFAAWSEVRARLLTVPLHLQTEASARFADLVIREQWLPVEIVEDLQRHFGWLDDFRAARMLGPERLHALHETLEDRIVRPITNPDVLNHFAPLIYLHRLGEQGRQWKAAWFATCLGAPLAELANSLDPRSRKRLGLNTDARLVVESVLSWANIARMGALLLVVALLLLPRVLVDRSADWAILLVGPLVAAMVLYLLKMAAAFISGLSRMQLQRDAAFQQRWDRIREHWACAALGLALLAGVALFNGLMADGLPIEFAGLPCLIGLLLAWPRQPNYSIVVLAGMVLMALIFSLPPFLRYDKPTLLCWMSVWMLGGLLTHLQRREIPGLSLCFRPVTNSLRLCDRYGYKLALAPMVLAGVVLIAVDGIHGGSVLAIWAVSIFGLYALQDRLTKFALARIDIR